MKIKDFATVVSGATPKTNVDDNWGDEYLWITPAEIDGKVKYIDDTERKLSKKGVKSASLNLLPKGTVLLSSRAPIGKVAIANADMYCNQGFKNLICNIKLAEPEYIYYWLSTNTEYLNSLGRGATFKEISKSIVEEIDIPLQSIDNQKRIVQTLDLAQSLIDKRKKQIETCDELIKSRFIEMFGNPISNKKRIKTFPMTEVCEIIDGDRGKNYPNQDEFFKDEFCLFLNAKNVTPTGFSFSNTIFITKEKDELLRKGKLQRGDVVLTTRGTIGNLAYYTDEVPFDNMRINSGMVILRMKKSLVEERFFIQQFRMQLDDIKNKIASGSAQPQLPISTMNKINILVPNIEEQNQFATFVQTIDKLKYTLQKSLHELDDNFNALVQKAFKGELFSVKH